MPATDPRVDAYIEKAKPFAQPVLRHLRALIHEACPQIIENIKWNFPVFEHKGIVCNIAAFKQHCAFGFWKTAIMKDPDGLFAGREDAMGVLGRITSLDDLPADEILLRYIREAVDLNEAGIKVPKEKGNRVAGKEPEVPEALLGELKKHPLANQAWEAFAPSHRKEYVQWIGEAKTAATRDKRIAATIEWVTEGKQRNWKYQK